MSSYLICDQGHINEESFVPGSRCTTCGGRLQATPGIDVLCRQLLGKEMSSMDEVREDVHQMVFGDDPDQRSSPGCSVRRAAWENLQADIEQMRDDAQEQYDIATQAGDERLQMLRSAEKSAFVSALIALKRRQGES